MKTKQNNLAARFLLGKLTEEENVKIEVEFFSENNHFENIIIAENDLIDEYVNGSLSPEDKRLFENRLLLNPRQRQRVEFAKTLAKYASNLPAENQDSTPSESKWLSAFWQLFSAKPLLSYSFAIAAFIFFAGAIWLAINNNLSHFPHNNELASKQTPTVEIEIPESSAPIEEQKSTDKVNAESETPKDKSPAAERLPKADKSQSSPQNRIEQPKKSAAIFSTIILPLGLTRDASAPSTTFDIPAKADFVNLQLNTEEGGFVSYFAVLETVEGRQIWNGKILKSAKIKNQKSVTAAVPARLLNKGDYIITLKGLTKDRAYEPAGDYSFTINRR